MNLMSKFLALTVTTLKLETLKALIKCTLDLH